MSDGGRGEANQGPKPDRGFTRLASLMHRLRAPGGCPWDAEQTHASIKHYLIEEAYEAVDAIDRGSDAELCDELGDVLLQVVFHAEMAAERGAFRVDDVIEGLCDKLVRRHPHVFGDHKVRSSADVVQNWARIKSEEAAARRTRLERPSSSLDGVPRALPALLRAHRLGQKAAAANFDWDDAKGVRSKLGEEMSELDAALALGKVEAAGDEIGDVLFTLASLARKLGCDAEAVLQAALDRFERRFREMESELSASGSRIQNAGFEERERAWTRAKQRERGPR